ncbi:Hsp70 family protein [Kiloniella sp.]|uniref:Hsp70 family protein n=1 Tax=Kiloniella sp. TaxID=1938587 RepID=UPI003B017699
MGAEKKYKLGKKQFSAPELSAIVLRSLKNDAETYLGHAITDVVISVPAYFNEIQRKAVKAAGKMAGLNPLRLINEPTAAALAYGLQDLDAESTFLVFDLGGGTFDVSILESFEGVMEVRATAGDAYLGGEDFTNSLASHLETKLSKPVQEKGAKSALLKIAEQVKLGLSSKQSVVVDSKIGKQDLKTEITRADFEEITTNILTRLRRPVERALYDARLSVEEIDRVVLVGGATRMPVIRSIVGKQLRRLPDSHLDPDHVVVMGVACQAGLIGNDKALEDVVMTDVSAFTLGIETARAVGNSFQAGYFLPILERNTVVPVSREEIVSAVELGQEFVQVDVYQGEAPIVASNIPLGKLSVPIPVNRKEHEAISIRFTYDVSGLLEVDATVLSTGKTSNLLIKNLVGEITDKEISATLQSLRHLKVHPREAAKNIHIKNRIEQCYAMARLEDREPIQEMLVEFEAILQQQNLTEIDKMCEQLSIALDQFENAYVQ